MDFVTFAPDYWDGPRHNRHYFCEELSKTEKVLFVSPPFYIGRLIEQYGRGLLNKSGVRVVRRNLINYAPSKLLFVNYRFPRVEALFRRLRIRKIKRLLRRHGFRDPVLLIWNPAYGDMIGEFGESLVVYYVYDQLSGYTGGSKTKSQEEIELLRRADLVFTLSRELYEENKKWSGNIYHLPNAVDFDLFSETIKADRKTPRALAEIRGPRIGYIGTINEKVDLVLLDHISRAHQDWAIVLVGRQNYSVAKELAHFRELIQRPNVHWLGPIPYQEVPAYIGGLDVCMMCYVINDWTYYGDPSKMHEYLACGKPTVATGLPSIREFSSVIAIPDSKEGWVRAIEEALRESDDDAVTRRVQTARENSYPFRVRRALELIQDTMENRPGERGDGSSGKR